MKISRAASYSYTYCCYVTLRHLKRKEIELTVLLLPMETLLVSEMLCYEICSEATETLFVKK